MYEESRTYDSNGPSLLVSLGKGKTYSAACVDVHTFGKELVDQEIHQFINIPHHHFGRQKLQNSEIILLSLETVLEWGNTDL